MLTHGNFCSDAEALIGAGIVSREDNVLSVIGAGAASLAVWIGGNLDSARWYVVKARLALASRRAA